MNKKNNFQRKKFSGSKKKSKKIIKPNENEEIKNIQSQYEAIDPQNVKYFSDFPLSWKTLKGLRLSNYKVPTDIQRESIGFALQGHDILGSAVTGSGKTLAFLIPVIENLFIKKWSRNDGVGAIIISPTRELAYQIFETLKKIGLQHDFSGGLIIGGKNLKFERSRMDQCNIIICTPGRLLQHMDENPLFNASNMQILVLDEADRCLDMGFEQTMNGIIENLPAERQTLLFSATQTKSVKELARLSLKNPVNVAPHEQQATTPKALEQNYVVINLEDKITMLWSFIKNHLKNKSIIFLSSCKQVKYIYEIFCKLRPGISLLALYGTLHQDRRVEIYNSFCRKSCVVMFATDIASRGLDFPVVNWVIQLDCPEDVTQYIHRAGRTARHNARGENLLVLMPSEETGMLEELKSKKIFLEKIQVDPKKMFSPRVKMEAFLAAQKDLKDSAQRAFVAYIKSVVLMKNKKIFNVDAINFDAYANSLGLVVTPRVRFLERLRKRQGNKEIKDEDASDDNEENLSENENNDEKVEKVMPPINFKLDNSEESSDDDNDLFKIKRKDHKLDDESDQNASLEEENIPNIEEIKTERASKILTKAAVAKRVVKKKIIVNKKVAFNEDGDQVLNPIKHLQSELGQQYSNQDDENLTGINIEKAKKVLQEEDKFDKQRFKDLVKAKHKKKKLKIKKQTEQDFDDFDSDDEDNSVDLGWLPDPDNIYGAKKSSDEDEEQFHRLPDKLYVKPGRKRIRIEDYNSENESSSEKEETTLIKKSKKMSNKLSVNEAEMLAMELIGS